MRGGCGAREEEEPACGLAQNKPSLYFTPSQLVLPFGPQRPNLVINGNPRSPDEPVPGSPDEPCAALAAGAPPRLVSKKETSFAPIATG
eukprot:scaffold37800_cov20-Tisochrysis_lutea.AAC.1